MSDNESDNEFHETFMGPHPKNAIARISVKIPPFWEKKPELWFAHIESQFVTNRITSDASKFHMLIGGMEQTVMDRISDIVLEPPENEKYETAKKRILASFAETELEKAKRLLEQVPLGTKKPSQLYNEMKQLAANRVTDDFLRNLWKQRLPPRVASVIEVENDVEKMVKLADRIIVYEDGYVNAATSAINLTSSESQMQRQINALVKAVEKMTQQRGRGRSHSRSRSRTRPQSRANSTESNRSNATKHAFCWYHRKFAENATQCRKPCSFGQNGNPSGN